MQTPLVSIIVPVYNAEKHLSACLNSLCAQSWPNLEILVLDDGSTDGSAALCARLCAQNGRLRYFRKPNTGVSDTRNQGLKLAAGKYVQFVDSDDRLAPDYTENLVRAAERTGADLVIAPYYIHFPSEVTGGAPETRVNGFLPAGVFSAADFARSLLKQNSSFYYGALWNKLYRRELFEAHGLRFLSGLPWSEDMVLNLQYLGFVRTVCAIDRPGYYYVQNSASLCHSKINFATVCQVKRFVYPYFRQLCRTLQLYPSCRADLARYFVSFSESNLPAGALQRAMDALSGTAHASRMLAASRRVRQRQAAAR